MQKLILTFIGCVFALGLYTVSAQESPTPTPPTARLQFTKSGQVSDNIIVWTISITNTGNAPSNPQTIQDILPAGAYWSVASIKGLDCTVGQSITDTTRQIMNCDTKTVPKATFDQDKFAIVNGLAQVSVYGYAEKCGTYRNIAVRNGIDVVTATVDIACPTPTPTATATATATPTQTSTPVITATNTPTPVPSTSTPSPIPTSRIAPLPPNTGNSDSTVEATYGIIFVGSLLTLVGLTAIIATGRPKRK